MPVPCAEMSFPVKVFCLDEDTFIPTALTDDPRMIFSRRVLLYASLRVMPTALPLRTLSLVTLPLDQSSEIAERAAEAMVFPSNVFPFERLETIP